MKQHRRGSKESHFIDPDFMEALDETDSSKVSFRRQAARKTQQFCRQVQRALNFVLADTINGDGVEGLFVEEVLPAPDCGRLLVRVIVPESLSLPEAMTWLSREAPRLRSEVASAITRKRAPELCFAPADRLGGEE